MSDIKFVNGIRLKKSETTWFQLEGSICIDELSLFLKGPGLKDVQGSGNGKRYLNFQIKESKGGKYYMCVNSWKPNQESQPQTEPQPDAEPVPETESTPVDNQESLPETENAFEFESPIDDTDDIPF